MTPLSHAVFAIVAGIFLILPIANQPAGAQGRIEILVNNEPITTYDIQNRTRLLKLTTGGRSGKSKAIEELIDERLKMQEAGRRNVTVDTAKVDQAIAGIASRTKMSQSRLEASLRQSGVNPKTLRNRIRAEIAWGEIVRARFRATVEVTERDVAVALGGDDKASDTISEFRLQEIVFIVPRKSSKAYESQRKREAEAFRASYPGCNSALEKVRGLKNVVVKPTMRRDESQLNGEMAEVLAETGAGQASRAVRSAEGFLVFGVCSKEAIRGASKASTETRQNLMNERGQLLARRYLRDLRADAVIDRR